MTTENKHTPGPWLAHQDDEGTWAVLDSVRGFVTFAFPAECGLGGDTEANARLISAAPDLLEAMERIVNAGGWYYSALELEPCDKDFVPGERLEETARAAIAKARGK